MGKCHDSSAAQQVGPDRSVMMELSWSWHTPTGFIWLCGSRPKHFCYPREGSKGVRYLPGLSPSNFDLYSSSCAVVERAHVPHLVPRNNNKITHPETDFRDEFLRTYGGKHDEMATLGRSLQYISKHRHITRRLHAHSPRCRGSQRGNSPLGVQCLTLRVMLVR